MELRHLRYFVAIAEALSFRGAARRLRVAQPALSKQIQDFENTCGARLFDRNTKRVQLTDAGAALLDEARGILSRAELLPQLAREAAHGRRGRLTIGNIAALTTGFLPRSLAAFHAKYPEVEVNLVELRLRHQRTALRSGRIQLGLVGGSAVPEDDEFDHERVVFSPLKVAMARTHPLAGMRRISLNELCTERFLGIGAEPDSSGHPDTIRALFHQRGLRPPQVKAVDSLDSLIALIGGAQGISILPGIVGGRRGGGVVTRPLKLEGNDGGFSLWAIWRKADASQLVRNFVEVLFDRTGRTLGPLSKR